MGVKQSLKAAVRPQSHRRHGNIDFYGDRFLIIYIDTAGDFAKTVAFPSIYRGRLYQDYYIFFYISRAIYNMHSPFLLALLLHFVFSTPAFAQYYSSAAATATSSLTPAEMSAAASVSSVFASLATATPQQSSDDGGSPGDADSTPGGGDAAGASGADTSSFNLSKGGLIAIIVVVTAVCIFGSMSSCQKETYDLADEI
jgi:hypothetical protein